MMLAVDAVGHEITTVEGLGTPEHMSPPCRRPSWRATRSSAASARRGSWWRPRASWRANPHPTLDEIKHGLSGNLCRCGTYPRIFEAVQKAAGDLSRRRGRSDMTQSPSPKPEAPGVTYTVKAGHASDPQTMEVHAAEGDLKPWDLDTKLRVVTGRQPRLDGPLKVTGRAKYTFDVNLPGMLWGRMIRASVPAGTIIRHRHVQGGGLPGVKAVWTTDARTVRFAGQDVAAVAAVSPRSADDAARLVVVTYEERPFVTDLQPRHEGGRPHRLRAGQVPGSKDVPRNGNVVGPRSRAAAASRGDVGKGLAEADVTVDATYSDPDPHPRRPRDPRHRREVGRRPPHDLGLHPGHVHRARGHGRGPGHRPQERHRHHRAHGRRLREQARRLGLGQRTSRWSPASWPSRRGRP